MKILLSVLAAAALGGGCYAESGYGYTTTTVGYGAPSMVYVDGSPGVQVIADYDYPVFFSDGMYWRYDGGIWYSSRWHDRGWGRTYNVPVAVRGISRPEGYVHYRGGVAARNAPVYRNEPVVRDHRYAPAAPVARPAPAPVARDHRAAPAPSRPVVRDHRTH